MTRQNWQQLLAALVALIVLALMWQIWQLIAPAFKAMAPVLAWTLLIAGVIIIVALTIGVVGAVVVFLRERHVAAETKLIEASKMPANERGFVGAYIDKSRKGTSILMPQVSAYSVETPGHVHIQTDNSNKGGPGGSADGWRERFAWAKLEWDKEKQAALNAGPSLNLLPSPRPTIEEIVEELSDDVLEFSPGKSLTTQKLIKVELRGKHIKVIGGSQMGKTSLIGAIIQQVCLKYSIAQLRLVVLDLEDVTGLLFEDDPHILEMKVDGQARKVHARNPEQVAQMLTWLDQVMLYRYELVHSRGLAYVDRLPRILIYFEEFLDWKKTLVQRVPDAKLRDDAIATINALSTRGLKVGMHLMVAAQVDYADPDLLSAIAQFVGINLAFCVKPTAARSAGFVDSERLKQNYASKTPGQYVIEMIGGGDMGVSPEFDARAKVKAIQQARFAEEEDIIDGEYEEMEDLQMRDVSQTPGAPLGRQADTTFSEWSDSSSRGNLSEKREIPANVRPFAKPTGNAPQIQPDTVSEERPREYRLSEEEIQPFIAAFKASGNRERALAAIGRGSRYRPHAEEIIQAYRLRRDA